MHMFNEGSNEDPNDRSNEGCARTFAQNDGNIILCRVFKYQRINTFDHFAVTTIKTLTLIS